MQQHFYFGLKQLLREISVYVGVNCVCLLFYAEQLKCSGFLKSFLVETDTCVMQPADNAMR